MLKIMEIEIVESMAEAEWVTGTPGIQTPSHPSQKNGRNPSGKVKAKKKVKKEE